MPTIFAGCLRGISIIRTSPERLFSVWDARIHKLQFSAKQIARRDPHFNKPMFVFEQQQSGSEFKMLSEAIQSTFIGLTEANKSNACPASLSHLCVGLKCGGSDGFSGISANPAVGRVSDMLAALGGRSLLSEFPELCGVEQELVDRCIEKAVADRFIQLMSDYSSRAKAVGSGFDMNPSPGNIRDGLVTDAMKSAGAARKGGSSPVTAVLDYPEYSTARRIKPPVHTGQRRGVRYRPGGRWRKPCSVHHRAGDADRKSHCAGAQDLNKFAARQPDARHH